MKPVLLSMTLQLNYVLQAASHRRRQLQVRLAHGVVRGLALVLFLVGALGIAQPVAAHPLPLHTGQSILATGGNPQAGSMVKDRAAAELDRKAGSGTSNRLEGTAQENMGRLKQKTGDITDDLGTQAEGAADRAKGKAKRQIGRSQDALEDTSETLQNTAAEAKEQAEEAGSNLVEGVKDFFR